MPLPAEADSAASHHRPQDQKRPAAGPWIPAETTSVRLATGRTMAPNTAPPRLRERAAVVLEASPGTGSVVQARPSIAISGYSRQVRVKVDVDMVQQLPVTSLSQSSHSESQLEADVLGLTTVTVRSTVSPAA